MLVAGVSGSGKTTLARRISSACQLPHIELDALFHGPQWAPRPSFERDVAEETGGDRWVVDSAGYPTVRDLLWERADTIIWLDLPRWQVMLRVLRRSLWRGLRRAELWNGNHESLAAWRDPEHPVRWAWTQHGRHREMVQTRLRDPRWTHVQVHRLTSARHARRWVRLHLIG